MDMHQALTILKTKEPRLELVAQYSFKQTLLAITAWPTIFISWDNPLECPQGVEEAFEWLWEGASLNEHRLNLLYGTKAIDMLSRLISAYLIYPDGTYNLTFIDLIEQKKHEAIYGNRK